MKMEKPSKSKGDSTSAGPGFSSIKDTVPKSAFEGSAGGGKSIKGTDEVYSQVSHFGSGK